MNHTLLFTHRKVFWAALAAALLSTISAIPVSGQETQELIDLMLKKGMITEEEAAQVRPDPAEQPDSKIDEPRGKDIRFYWKNGLNFESVDGKTYRGKLGGRIELDTAFFSEDEAIEDNIGDQEATIGFRRARLSLEGEFNTSTPVFYEFSLDFAGAEIEFKDMYIGLADVPVVGSIQAGHFKEPFSLEVLTSEKYIPFMERALPLAPSAPRRNTGVMVGRPVLNNRMTWALGAFANVGDSGEGVLDSNYRVTGRLTGVPYREQDRLLHLGVAGSFFSPEDDLIRLRTRPESAWADYFVNTGFFGARYGYLMGLETALVLGPFSLQGEYLHLWLDGTYGADPNFHGYYVYGSYFLTGESRAYKTASGKFGRMQPKHNFSFRESGWGAWEVGVRYSSLNLNDAGINGGEIDGITAGLNWYLNANTRMMFNYVLSQVDRSTFDGDTHIFMTRLQVDF